MVKMTHHFLNWRKAGVVLVTLLVACTGALGAGLEYPKARRDEALDNYNGAKVADPYRWLERLDSPETREWVRAESKLTDEYLDQISVRAALKQRLSALLNFE